MARSGYGLLLLLTLLIGALAAALSLAQQVTDADIAKQFFPERLVTESVADFEKGGPPPFQAFDFVVADLNGTGIAEFIVAAYTNGFSGAIRVLRKQGGSAVLVDEPFLPTLGGIYPKVTLRDLDSDGRPEVIVSFSSARGPAANWIFKWDKHALHSIGPTSLGEDGNISTVLSEAAFADLDGDGVLEVVNPPQQGPLARNETQLTPDELRVYTLRDGAYTFLKPLVFFGVFVRSSGMPTRTERGFTVTDTARPYLLRVVNGESGRRNRVTSGEVSLNGLVVVSRDRLKQQVFEVLVPVTLKQSNTLGVALQSDLGGQITVTVEPQ